MHTKRHVVALWLLTGLVSSTTACDERSASKPTTELGAAQADDAAVPRDGSAPPDAAVASGCVESAPRFSAPINAAGRGFDLAVDGLDIHATWSVATCPAASVGGIATGHALRYARFGTTGEVGEPEPLVLTDPATCAQVRDPSLLLLAPHGGEKRAYLSFLATRYGPWEAFQLDPTSRPLEPQRLDDTPDDAVARGLVATTIDDSSLIVWIEGAAERGDRVVLSGSESKELIAPGVGTSFLRLALGQLGEGPAPHERVLAFVANDGMRSRLFAQRFDPGANSKGDPVLLSELVTPAADVDLVALDDGAAVVFSEGQGTGSELRYVALGEDGAPLAPTRKLTSGAELASGPSIARFASGLVVAYRAAEDASAREAVLRLAFLDPRGNVAGFRDVLRTSQSGGAVVLRATVDGRLVIGFVEVEHDGAQSVQIARVTCYD